jgi:putative ABC transport system substrate-binding protein
MPLLTRRTFVATLAGGMLAAPLVAGAQQHAGKIPRIGLLLAFSPEHPQAREWSHALREGLRELGYVEGQNIAIESRSAQGRFERVPDVLAELVRLNVDVIVSLEFSSELAISWIPRLCP